MYLRGVGTLGGARVMWNGKEKWHDMSKEQPDENIKRNNKPFQRRPH